MLTVALVTSLLILSNANAHTPAWTIPTSAYIGVSPNPVGVGQTALVQFGIDPWPPTANLTGGDRWVGLTVTITRPDGIKENTGPFASNATGQSFLLYTPTMTGTYRFDLHFPGQTLSKYNPLNGLPGIDSEYVNDTYLPSESSTTLRVQQTPVDIVTPTPSATSSSMTTITPSSAATVEPTPTLGIILQEDKPLPQTQFLSPITLGAVVVVVAVVVIVAVMLRRLFASK